MSVCKSCGETITDFEVKELNNLCIKCVKKQVNGTYLTLMFGTFFLTAVIMALVFYFILPPECRGMDLSSLLSFINLGFLLAFLLPGIVLFYYFFKMNPMKKN